MIRPISIPYACQLSWFSLSGYAAFRLQKSCLGNELDSTAKKIAAYIPRIVIALPLLLTCATLDFVATLLKATVGLPFRKDYINPWTGGYRNREIFFDFISLIALPIILVGYLLFGKIPASHRPGASFFVRSTPNVEGILYARESALHAAWTGRPYVLKRILDCGNHRSLLHPTQLYLSREINMKGSLLAAAIHAQHLECIDLLIGLGANFTQMDADGRLNALFYAFQGSVEILKQVLRLSGFNPAETFTISPDHFTNFWFWPFSTTAVEEMTNISLAELALIADSTRGLRKLQLAEIPIRPSDYQALSCFKYFLNHPETSPNAHLSTQLKQENGKWGFVTEITNKEHAGSSKILKENPFFKIWKAHSATLRGKQDFDEFLATTKQHLNEVLREGASLAECLDHFLPANGDIAKIVISYL